MSLLQTDFRSAKYLEVMAVVSLSASLRTTEL